MLFVPTAQIMAAEAQRRHVAGVRLDGPVTDRGTHRASLMSRIFGRADRRIGQARGTRWVSAVPRFA